MPVYFMPEQESACQFSKLVNLGCLVLCAWVCKGEMQGTAQSECTGYRVHVKINSSSLLHTATPWHVHNPAIHISSNA